MLLFAFSCMWVRKSWEAQWKLSYIDFRLCHRGLVLSVMLQLCGLAGQNSIIPIKSLIITNHVFLLCTHTASVDWCCHMNMFSFICTFCKDSLEVSMIPPLWCLHRGEAFECAHTAVHHYTDPLWWVFRLMNVAHSLQCSLGDLFPRRRPSRMPINIAYSGERRESKDSLFHWLNLSTREIPQRRPTHTASQRPMKHAFKRMLR